MITLSQLMTLGAGKPSVVPTFTSDRMPRMVLVIGVHVTAVNTASVASCVQDANRTPARGCTEIGPDDVAARYHSGVVCAASLLAARDDGRVLREPAVRLLQRTVGGGQLGGLEHCGGAPAQQLGTTRPLFMGESIEPLDELIVELHQYLSPTDGPYGRSYGRGTTAPTGDEQVVHDADRAVQDLHAAVGAADDRHVFAVSEDHRV